ncbi:MAG: HEPN domain-containing protein [Desulfobulbaceae bacterium]|nr:HEPN domain-containing protein [Desulfobulbaceae bacterium]
MPTIILHAQKPDNLCCRASLLPLAQVKRGQTPLRPLLERQFFNPCLQNVQQSIEKYLKAVLLEKNQALRKTHTVTEIVRMLAECRVNAEWNDEGCDLLDAIYHPAKYPLGGVLPSFVTSKGSDPFKGPNQIKRCVNCV